MVSLGNAVYHFLFSQCNHSVIFGYDYAAFWACCSRFLRSLQAVGFTLTIVLDGMTERIKTRTRLMRREDEYRQLMSLSSLLPPHNARASDSRFCTVAIKPPSVPLKPELAEQCFIQVAHSLGVDVQRTLAENDSSVAGLATSMKAFGVLSMDSDFYIYSNPGYIPLDSLAFEDDGSVRCVRYRPQDLAAQLQIASTWLPLFAVSGCLARSPNACCGRSIDRGALIRNVVAVSCGQ